MPINDAPFSNKYKLECECAACESKYKIIYFEDDVSGELKVCPFCGEPAEEYSEQTESSEEVKEETIYTDDDDALFESDVIDDDYMDEDPLDDDGGER